VIIYHIRAAMMPGGFIGVDVFFVISGFLISRNIMGELAAGRFSLLEFYRRRVKRIAPPMLVVVGVTLVASQWLLLPADADAAAGSALWSIASFANVYFWRHIDTSYFAASSEQLPLLHLWSLGVEEQFYLIWPLVLALVFRKRHVLAGIVICAVASVALAQVMFASDPMFAFYMLPTRAGELLAGAIVAALSLKGRDSQLSMRSAQVAGVAGAALIAGSLALLNDGSVFPGVLAIPPVLGSALLIFSGVRGGIAARALSARPMVWVGRVSYSAYLWHWPLLAFYRYGHSELTVGAGVTIFVATFVLAWLSYRFVEQPARTSKAEWVRVLTTQYAIPGGALMALALAAMKLDGYTLHALGDYRARLDEVRRDRTPAYAIEYVCQRQRLTEADATDARCVVGAASAAAPSAILWGDSNAAHYVGMLGAFAREGGYRMRNIAVGSCPPIDTDPTPFVRAWRRADCQASLKVARAAVRRYPTVIMSAAYTDYLGSAEMLVHRFAETVTRLSKAGKRVIVIGKIPEIPGYDPTCAEKALSYPMMVCRNATATAKGDVVRFNERLRALLAATPNVSFYDPTSIVCPAGTCSALGPDGEPIYFDVAHLTIAGSWALGERVVAASGVPDAFRRVTIVDAGTVELR
jgi:peptidoglycan/LPS O-acetylase OafA/YrhL